jgi:hypothetical protein
MAIYYSYIDGNSITNMIGETLVAVDGMIKGSDDITFTCASGRRFRMWHRSDCCESVDVEDVAGDVADLIGTPLVMAEDVSNDESLIPPEGAPREYPAESETWTFVKLATVKGYVTLRWYGSSNGYYSEDPAFGEIKA